MPEPPDRDRLYEMSRVRPPDRQVLSLMALTVSTGFVVDDAIVVIENISHHLEAGASRAQAALEGAKEPRLITRTVRGLISFGDLS